MKSLLKTSTMSDLERIAFFGGNLEYSIQMARIGMELEMKPEADLVREDLAALRAYRQFLIYRIAELREPHQFRNFLTILFSPFIIISRQVALLRNRSEHKWVVRAIARDKERLQDIEKSIVKACEFAEAAVRNRAELSRVAANLRNNCVKKKGE